ncbi:uncharacterized protein LOC124498822 [Dermatophagoides farinae]|uniref:Uncharacterized protein n=1 Tax=Dermatophagoides farinae TaxID=6954 RepID=A0A922L6T7_DERFA|nr:uncharacterized protein LOC124498822 [Dermatophagoides farinae]KAH9511943.1 hypothetical protein DERF_010366 [Dermatophagoides farinae]
MRKTMRLNGQTNARIKSSRSMIDNENSTGILSIFRYYSKFMLGFSLFSLSMSIVLLFIGTYAYYEAHMIGTTTTTTTTTTSTTTSNIDTNNESNINLQFYRSIMNFYGINEINLSMLYRLESTIAIDDHQGKLHSYQISMLFVAVISILIEVGLICSIIFEHFKLSLFYNIIMIVGLFHHLSTSSSSSSSSSSTSTTSSIMVQNDNTDGITSSISLIYQILFLILFLIYSFSIKAKNKFARRLLIKNEIELNADQRFIQKA